MTPGNAEKGIKLLGRINAIKDDIERVTRGEIVIEAAGRSVSTLRKGDREA